jgi:hypothetical protein
MRTQEELNLLEDIIRSIAKKKGISVSDYFYDLDKTHPQKVSIQDTIDAIVDKEIQ